MDTDTFWSDVARKIRLGADKFALGIGEDAGKAAIMLFNPDDDDTTNGRRMESWVTPDPTDY